MGTKLDREKVLEVSKMLDIHYNELIKIFNKFEDPTLQVNSAMTFCLQLVKSVAYCTNSTPEKVIDELKQFNKVMAVAEKMPESFKNKVWSGDNVKGLGKVNK